MNHTFIDQSLREKIWLRRLVEEYDQIVRKYQIKGMKPANLRLSDGSTTLGTWSPSLRLITLSKKLLLNAPWETVIQIFKHEIAHQIADEILGGDVGHGQVFASACQKIWVEPWARNPKVEIGYQVKVHNNTSTKMNLHFDSSTANREINYQNSTMKSGHEHLQDRSAIRSEQFQPAPSEVEEILHSTDATESQCDLFVNEFEEKEFWKNFNSQKEDPETKRLKERLSKLLALSESQNPHEATIALARAKEMQQGILLTVMDNHDSLKTRIMRPKKRRLERHYSQIAAILSSHYNVRVIFSREFDTRELVDFQTMEILGQEHCVELAEYVYNFLLNTLKSSYQFEIRNRHIERRSYYTGLLDGLREKLKTPVSSLILHPENYALIQRQGSLLDSYFSKRHPLVQTRKVNGRSLDGNSFERGREKGKSIDIRSPIKGNERKLLG